MDLRLDRFRNPDERAVGDGPSKLSLFERSRRMAGSCDNAIEFELSEQPLERSGFWRGLSMDKHFRMVLAQLEPLVPVRP